MPTFAYVAVDVSGATVEGTRKGETIGDVKSWLGTCELYPIKIEERRRRLLDYEITSEKLTKRELMHFSRQLSVFVKAGIPIITALETIADESQDKVLRRVIADMVARLSAGSTFADAAGAHPEAFPTYYIGVLRTAELTGRLDDTVDDLAQYLDREIQARSRLVSALIYPSIVCALALSTIVILAIFVLPQFRDLFEELDSDLPLSTKILLAVVDFVMKWWPVLAVLVVAAVVGWWWSLRSRRVKHYRDKLVLRLPGIGGIIQYSILERFCRILSTMSRAGVALPDAMDVVAQSTSNSVFRERIETARHAMVRGDGLARPLIETQLFPGAARQMIKVGEESGTLEEQLGNAALYFDRELDLRIRRFTNAFEPATIVVVGIGVGFVAIALVQAMYGMLDGFEQ